MPSTRHTELCCRDRRDMEREEEAKKKVGGGVRGGPLCPQLSEPANDLSQGGCCKRAGKLKQTPRREAATCVAACCHSKHPRA